MIQRLFVIGASGNVGREFIKKIISLDTAEHHKNPSKIVGIANSTHYEFKPDGILVEDLKKISLSQERAKEVLSQKIPYKDLGILLDQVKSTGMDGEIIFIDITAGKEALLKFHKKVITASRNSIVTANKNPISLYGMEDFKILTQYHKRYDTNTTVMGGGGALNFVCERYDIRDFIRKVEGCFSGTLGYILSELEKEEKSFSGIVRAAKEDGYTEPNPWDDLNGLDVARKLLILARYSGLEIDMQDLQIEPLISEKYGELSGEEFLDALKEEDMRFYELVAKAKKRKSVLRYVASLNAKGNSIEISVKLNTYPKDSDFGSLSGTANLVVIETDTLEAPIPHVIKSRGAGLGVTADALRTGVSKMLPIGVSRL